MSQSKSLRKVFDVGSNRSYYVPGRPAWDDISRVTTGADPMAVALGALHSRLRKDSALDCTEDNELLEQALEVIWSGTGD